MLLYKRGFLALEVYRVTNFLFAKPQRDREQSPIIYDGSVCNMIAIPAMSPMTYMDEIQICDFLLSLHANDVGQEHPWSFPPCSLLS
jgi:hypothetical protein